MTPRRWSIDLQDVAARQRTREILPWTTEQLVSLLAANAVGLLLVAVGWWQTLSRDDSASEQFGWLNLAILGLLVAGSANVLWLARGRRTVTLAKSAVLPHSWIRGGTSERGTTRGGMWASVPGLAVPTSTSNGSASNGSRQAKTSGTGAYVATTTMSRYHRPDCILAVGKDVTAADAAAHADAGRRPCEICRP